MPDVVTWKSAEEIMRMITVYNAVIKGMNMAQAAETLGFTLMESGLYVKTVAEVTTGVSSGLTAGEAIAGASLSGGATTSVANLTLFTTASGETAVGALGSIALPIASVCLVGAAGYALGDVIGDTIDRAFPDFFQGLFESISTLVTGDKYGLAFIFDGAGRVYMPKAAQEAVIEYVEPIINVLNGESAVKVDSYTVPFKVLSVGDVFCADDYETWDSTVLEINSTTPVYVTSWVATSGLFHYYMCSKEKFTITYKSMNSTRTSSSTTSFGGKTNSKSAIKNIERITTPLVQGLPYSTGTSSDVKLLYAKILGSCASAESAPKLVPYEMPTVAPISTPTEMPDWVPVELPTTLPQEMPDRIPQLKPDTELQPDTVTPYLPQPAPYPESVPLPEPVPEPNPNPIVVPNPILVPVPIPTPSPEIDPSQEPVPTPSPQPSPNPPPPEDSGDTPAPILPVSRLAGGLLNVYNPTSSEIKDFGKWLWTTFSGDLIDTLGKLFNNPMDAVIGLHELYCTPITGENSTIKAGFLDSEVTSRLVTSRYSSVPCGAVAVPEYWGNYLDYSPYTTVHCYLPFIGIVELNADDIIGHGVQIDYKVDAFNGSCVAIITTAKNESQKSVVYQFSGNCAVDVPITSGMKSAIQSALIGAGTCAVGVAGGAAIAGKVATSASMVAGASKGGMVGGMNSKNSVSYSGTFGSSFGAMGLKKPYLIIKRPVQKVVYGYNEKYGYPAHKMVTIGDCSGYLRCRDFEFKSSTATEEEKKLIEELLQKGVYV